MQKHPGKDLQGDIIAGIFKAYDIRGLANKELDEGIAYLIGRAFIQYTKTKKVLVGHDMRTSSPKLTDALIKGITDQGATVINIGLCSTPMFYYATKKYPAGIMVTASHNPKKYNGFKLCREKAIPIGQGSGMEEIEQLVINQKFDTPKKLGKIKQKNYLNKFTKFSSKFLKTKKPFKIIVDTGNGMGGLTYGNLISKFRNVEIIPMYFELDGNFPNHIANPIKEDTLKAIKKRVIKEKADLGIAIDGDGDRCIFIDEKGNSIPPCLTGALISEEILKKRKGNIIYTVINNKIFIETINNNGGKAIESPVGHAYVKKIMRANKGLFAVEVSGHTYFKEMEYCENTIIALCKILNLIAKKEKKLSELIKPLYKYSSIPETNFKITNRKKGLKIIEKVKKKYSKGKINELDGLKVVYDDWWFSIRLSNTEPLLRLNMEANTKQKIDAELKKIKNLIMA